MKKLTVTIDTAADVSVMSRSMMEDLGLVASKSSKIKLHGFQGKNLNMEIDEICRITLHVHPSKLYLSFWVCDIDSRSALL